MSTGMWMLSSPHNPYDEYLRAYMGSFAKSIASTRQGVLDANAALPPQLRIPVGNGYYGPTHWKLERIR